MLSPKTENLSRSWRSMENYSRRHPGTVGLSFIHLKLGTGLTKVVSHDMILK